LKHHAHKALLYLLAGVVITWGVAWYGAVVRSVIGIQTETCRNAHGEEVVGDVSRGAFSELWNLHTGAGTKVYRDLTGQLRSNIEATTPPSWVRLPGVGGESVQSRGFGFPARALARWEVTGPTGTRRSGSISITLAPASSPWASRSTRSWPRPRCWGSSNSARSYGGGSAVAGAGAPPAATPAAA
jgi:hypothetical protein